MSNSMIFAYLLEHLFEGGEIEPAWIKNLNLSGGLKDSKPCSDWEYAFVWLTALFKSTGKDASDSEIANMATNFALQFSLEEVELESVDGLASAILKVLKVIPEAYGITKDDVIAVLES